MMRVLLIDDDEDDYVMLRDLLAEVKGESFGVQWAPSYDAGLEAIRKGGHDVCILDYRLGGRTGLDLLKQAIGEGCKTPMILLTGYGEHDVDLEAMRVGAADYLIKDQVSPFLIERSIRYSIHRASNLEELREREEAIRSLLDSTFEGVVVRDQDSRIIEANRVAAGIFGRGQEEMVGTDFADYFAEEHRGAVREMTLASSIVDIEAVGIRSDGSRVHLELAGKPYVHRGRNVRLTAFRDVTARKQLEAQILMQDRLASVGLLASSLAHEIGTPLGVIRGRAEYLAMQLQGDAAIQKNAEVIIAQIDRVSKLIRSLLNLARGDQSQPSGEVSIPRIAREVCELMAHELRKHSIELRNELSDDVRIAVRAEAGPLHQVLLNLLVNSVHAIQDAVRGGRASGHFIRMTAQDLGSSWAVSVQDSGSGISEKNLKNLFKPFFTTKDIGVGTGLGLATSYGIIESWGGRIQVESREGAGTTFTLVLPKAARG